MKQVRGIRNNNPANIRRGASWKGLVPFLIDSCNKQRYYDKSFCQFESMTLGVRALFVLLRTYHYKYKLHTISLVLHRFAPLSENNTFAYIANVVRYFNDVYCIEFGSSPFYVISDDTILCWFLNPHSPSVACRTLAKAICKQESGYDLTDEMIDEAIKLL